MNGGTRMDLSASLTPKLSTSFRYFPCAFLFLGRKGAMKTIYRASRCFALIIFFLILASVSVNGIRIAVTTAKSLNVRDAPSGKVIDALPLGSAVGIASIYGTWAHVVYFKSGNKSSPRYGWVSTKFLKITSSGSASVSGGNCESEYKSGAEVCIEVSDANLECNESIAGDYYSDCDVEIEYKLTTDYRGHSSISVDVECKAEISYETRGTYGSSESDDESKSHTLYANGSDYSSVDIDFSFSMYQQVYRVELESVECEIDSLDLW